MNYLVVIPARNEELLLPKAVASVRLSAKKAGILCEIVVVLNRCTDRTEEVAKDLGCRVVHEDARNLSVIRNAGARAFPSERIVTMDADSAMSENMFQEIERVLNSGRSIGGGVLIVPERWSLGILLTGLCLLPLVVFEGIACGLFFCSRRDFEAIGGFDEKLCSVEDIDFARRLKELARRQRKSFTILYRARIITSCRKFDHFGDWHFLLHPRQMKEVFRGRNQALADKYWYSFKDQN